MKRPATHKNEMAALLPFYITGRLGLRDQMRIEQWIEESPRGAKALENAYADQRAAINANEAISSPSGALGRLLKDIDKEPSQAWSNYVGGNMASWIMSWLNVIPSALTWTAVAALAFITIIQSSLLWTHEQAITDKMSGAPLSQTRSQAKTMSAFIRFAPNTGINEISTLLKKAGATIIDGPKSNNAYIIRFAAGKNLPPIKQRLTALAKRSDLVHFVAPKEPPVKN